MLYSVLLWNAFDVLMPAVSTLKKSVAAGVAPIRRLAMGAKALVFITAVSGTNT